MTATNSVEPAKDGTGAAFNWTFAAESVSGNKAQKTYIGEPSGETIISPATSALQTTINTTLGSPLQQSTPIASVVSAALEASHIFKVTAGNFYDGYCLATSVSGYFMLFDQTTVPADGAVTPKECVSVAAGTQTSISAMPGFPRQFSTGIVAVFSTTGPFTKTASATAFMSVRFI